MDIEIVKLFALLLFLPCVLGVIAYSCIKRLKYSIKITVTVYIFILIAYLMIIYPTVDTFFVVEDSRIPQEVKEKYLSERAKE